MFSKGLQASIVYGLNSAVMNICNKVLINYFGFRTPLCLLFFQYILTVLVIEVLRRQGCSSFPRFTWQEARDSIGLTCTFLLNIVLCLYGMNYVNLPMYVTLRKLGILFVFVIDLYFDKALPRPLYTFSIFLISAGALISGANDFKSDPFGYVLIAGANLANALQLFFAKHQKARAQPLNPWSQPYYTAMLSLPVVYILVFATQEHVDFFSQYYSEVPSFYMALLVIAVLGTMSNFTLFLCATLNSPMAVMITGNMKDIVVVAVGLMGFQDVDPGFYFVSGLVLSMFGGLLYSYAKYIEAKKGEKVSPK